MFPKLIETLSGYKTYIACAAWLVVMGLYLAGKISVDAANNAIMVIAPLIPMALRSAVTKVSEKVDALPQ